MNTTPLDFGKYTSMYVDPRSVTISETLRDRFLENFKTSDQVALAVDQMKAAQAFENDVKAKNELQKNLDAQLESFANRGDYENLGFAIHKAAKDFGREYAPIKQNYETYQATLADLQKQMGEGKINPEQYQNAVAGWLTKGYKGFEIDTATKRVKEGSMFAPPVIYQDPKIMDRIAKRLEILHPEKYKNTIKKVAMNGSMLDIETSTGTESIDINNVKDVINAVYAEPDVKAYVEQLADMKTYNATANKQPTDYLNPFIQNYEEAITKLSGSLADKQTPAVKREISNKIQEYQSEIDKIKSISDKPDEAYDYLKSQYKDQIMAPGVAFGSKKAYKDIETSYKEDVNSVWLADYNRQQDALKEYEGSEGVSDVYSYSSLGGETVSSKQSYIAEQKQIALELEKQANDPANTEEVREEKANLAKLARQNADLAQQHVDLALNKSISYDNLSKHDPTLVGFAQNLYKGSTPAQLGQKLVALFANTQSQEFKNFESAYDRKNGEGALARHFENYYQAKRELGAGINVSDRLGKGSNLQRNGVTNIFTDYKFAGTQLAQKFNDEINASHVNDKFKEMKTSSKVYYNLMPGIDNAQRLGASNAAKNYFTNFVIPENAIVYNTTEDGMEQKTGVDYSGRKTVKYGYVPDFVDPQTGQRGGWQLETTDENGKNPDTVIFPASQVSSPSLKRYMSQPSMAFANTIDKYNTREKGMETSFLIEPKSNFKGAPKLTIVVKSEGTADPLVKIVRPDGTGIHINEKGEVESGEPKFMRMDSEEIRQLVEGNIYNF